MCVEVVIVCVVRKWLCVVICGCVWCGIYCVVVCDVGLTVLLCVVWGELLSAG